jgi:hypothetical protein
MGESIKTEVESMAKGKMAYDTVWWDDATQELVGTRDDRNRDAKGGYHVEIRRKVGPDGNTLTSTYRVTRNRYVIVRHMHNNVLH